MFKFENEKELIQFINDEILNTSEALSILGCSRQYLNKLVKNKSIIPIKELEKDKWYFKKDVMDFKKTMRK